MPKIYKVDKKKINLSFKQDIDNIFVCEPCYNHIHSNKLKELLRISNSASEGKQNKIINIGCNIDCINNTNNYINDKCGISYKPPISYTKCYLCNRMVSNIINGMDIIKFLNKTFVQTSSNNIVTDEILLQIAKYSNWQYNDIYDNFNADLVKKFKFTRQDYQNINQAMNNLEGLPALYIINERVEGLHNYLTKEIEGHSFH